MGSVRKLALFVVVGLIVISTAVTVYTANEPNRRDDETSEQGGLSIERASSLYITYCLQCHGPAGLGNMETDANGESMGRVGAPLNQSLMTQEEKESRFAIFQSDDPVEQGIAEDWIRFRIMYGAPDAGQLSRNYDGVPAMPSFRHALNVEQINDLVWLIMNGDWNYVYNAAVHSTGVTVCEATPEADREESCDHAMAYPTVPVAADEAPEGEGEATPEAGGEEGSESTGGDHQVTTTDNAYDTDQITVKPGDTITITNEGFAQHDMAIDDLGVQSELINNGDTVTITIPEDAAPGDYEFYCTVVGHKEQGMVGTLTVEAP